MLERARVFMRWLSSEIESRRKEVLMIWIIAGFVIGAFFGICTSGELIRRSISEGLICGFLAALVGNTFALAIGAFMPAPISEIIIEERHLVAFNDRFAPSGSFFLDTGSTNDTSYYIFYEKDANGAIKLGKLPTDDAAIYETNIDNNSGVLRITHSEGSFALTLWYFVLPYGEDKYEFFVPKGTVKHGFTADLE